MRRVGYDAVTLGNHEFDYKTPRMFSLLDSLQAPVTGFNYCECLVRCLKDRLSGLIGKEYAAPQGRITIK